MFNANTPPRFVDRSEGVWRRLILLPFNVRIPEKDRRPELATVGWWTKSGELPGILNWSLEGLQRLRARKFQFTTPEVCRIAADQHRTDCNPARAFLLECYVRHDDGVVPAREVYDAYRCWCDLNGYRSTLASHTFGREVVRLWPGVKSATRRIDGASTRCYVGIRQRGNNACNAETPCNGNEILPLHSQTTEKIGLFVGV
jgi:phage/plasmid-associated DNA primase